MKLIGKFPTFSILIPTFRNPKIFQTCIESIYANTDSDKIDFEIVTRDNSIVNKGFPASMNELVRRANGEYIIMLNDDSAVVEKDWIQKMYDQRVMYAREHGEKIIVAQGCHRSGQGVWYCPFWNTMMKRKDFLHIGGLDESFGIGMYDDIDFSWRATGLGYKILTSPAVVHHMGDGSSIKEKIQKYEGIDYNELKDKNTKHFEEKWKEEIEQMDRKEDGR